MNWEQTDRNPIVVEQRQRIFELLRRHVGPEHATMNDIDFIKDILRRLQKHWDIPILDPAE